MMAVGLIAKNMNKRHIFHVAHIVLCKKYLWSSNFYKLRAM